MVIVPCIEIPPHRNIALIDHLRRMIVHVGILIVHRDACREHIPQHHPFAKVSRNGLIPLRRISALHPARYPDELFYICLPFRGGKFRIAPVIYYRTDHEHDPAGTGKVLLRAERTIAERIQKGCDG